eukprot:TRINITY_DN5065_c0_g1_i8.p1 TRINITY_DN5065_c0_g1~~TRINITY_DN5065_c0_g1_i8.p1  ORF type:complete len:457 (-),score=162.04 TRINITY_DN5065_c0_g1_i8:44-1414(-)
MGSSGINAEYMGLHRLNSDLAEQFEKMMKELRKASLVFRKLSSNAMSIQKKELEVMYKNMEVLLMNWSSLMENQWRHFKRDFADYFKYYMFEGEAMLELARTSKNTEELYLAKETELSIIKHKLFKEKDFDKWKLLPEDRKIFEQTTLIYNKKLSFPKMLPAETKVVEDLFLKHGYYLNRVKAELDRTLNERVADMLTHFAAVSENYAKTTRELTNMWLEFAEKIEPGDDGLEKVELHVHLDVEGETEVTQSKVAEDAIAFAPHTVEDCLKEGEVDSVEKNEADEAKEQDTINYLEHDAPDEAERNEEGDIVDKLKVLDKSEEPAQSDAGLKPLEDIEQKSPTDEMKDIIKLDEPKELDSADIEQAIEYTEKAAIESESKANEEVAEHKTEELKNSNDLVTLGNDNEEDGNQLSKPENPENDNKEDEGQLLVGEKSGDAYKAVSYTHLTLPTNREV